MIIKKIDANGLPLSDCCTAKFFRTKLEPIEIYCSHCGKFLGTPGIDTLISLNNLKIKANENT